MRKKLLSILLVVLMTLVMIPTMVFAEDLSVTIEASNNITASGIDSDGTHFNVIYEYSDGNGWDIIDKNESFRISAKGDEKIKKIELLVGYVTRSNLNVNSLIASPSGTFSTNGKQADINEGDTITLSFDNPVSSVQINWIDQTYMSWIQIKSATIYYEEANSSIKTVSDILPKDFPTTLEDAWLNNKGNEFKAYLDLSDNSIKIADKDGTIHFQCSIQSLLTPNGNNYEVNLTLTTATFIMTNDVLTGIELSSDGSIDSLPYLGVYADYVTIADLLKIAEGGFPSTEQSGWFNGNGKRVFKGNNVIHFDQSVNLSEVLQKDADNNYYCVVGGRNYTFVMTSEKLTSIIVSNALVPGFDGEFFPHKYLNNPISKPEGYSQDVEFVTNASFTTYGDVTVKVDGTTLTQETHYNLEKGSTHVILMGSYLSILPVGTHTITIDVAGYNEISQDFIITPTTPTPSPNPGYIVPNTSVK